MQEFILELMRRWQLPRNAWNLIILGASLLIGLIINLLLALFARNQRKEYTDFVLVRSLLRHMGKPFNFFVPLFILNLLLPVMRLSPPMFKWVDRSIEILLIVGFSWGLLQFIKVLQDFAHFKINIHQANNLRQRRIITQLLYIRRVASIIIVLLTIGAILLSFSAMRKIGTGLLTGVGISGIIIGFAAQRSLANLLAGFQIAFTQPIRIDDEVIVQNEFGWIEEITLTYVVVRIWDERRLILPINYFIEQPFENWTRSSADMRGSIFYYVDYSLPVDVIREEFMRQVEANPLWDKRHASLIVSSLKENVMELRGVVSGRNSGDVFILRTELREGLVKFIQEKYPNGLPKYRTEFQSSLRLEPSGPQASGSLPIGPQQV